MDLVDAVGRYVAVVAGLGLILLVPLFLSQRRDLARLHDWMAIAPDHPAADLAASEAILDRAEAELEELEAAAAPVTPAAPAVPATPPAGLTPAARVTGERPALERITMERAALEPHRRWHRFALQATRPRVLTALAVVAVLVGAAAIFASGRLVGGNETGGRQAKVGAVNPADVRVAVLNGTSVAGLAGRVADDVTVNGFQLGNVTNSTRHFDQTVVMFEPGQQRAAQKVARDLGVKPVQPIDEASRRLAGDADVVVIAGDDRANP